MMTENELKAFCEQIYGMFRQLERDAVERICQRLNEIGQLSTIDAHRLRELSRIGRDVEAIEREIALAIGQSQAEVNRLLSESAELLYGDSRHIFDELALKWVPFAENPLAQELVSSAVGAINANIASLLTGSISGTIGFVNTKGNWQPLADYYQDVVDYAILQARTGQTDYYSAIRQAIKRLSDNGMCLYDPNTGRRAVAYESGYIRRLDSSVRNAFSGGQKRLSIQLAKLQGEQFGADGMEISWHVGARPSHVDFAGKQYNMQEYNDTCVPLLEDYNCYHYSWPILLGISTPAHSQEELAELNARDAELHYFEGKGYTAYEARQMQRNIETAMRREKDRAVAFKAAGDRQAEITAKAKVTALNIKYNAFSTAMGLDTKAPLAAVTGYTRGASVGDFNKLLGLTTKNGISIMEVSKHIVDQAGKRGIMPNNARDALQNPLNIGKIRSDRTQQFIGARATVAVNVDIGKLVTIWPTGSKARKKYGVN